MHSVIVLEEAGGDLFGAQEFYRLQDADVAAYFIASLLSDLESLVLLHGIHPIHFGLHRMLASRFPFGIYYRESSHETQVMAILDMRRDPNWIRKELDNRRI